MHDDEYWADQQRAELKDLRHDPIYQDRFGPRSKVDELESAVARAEAAYEAEALDRLAEAMTKSELRRDLTQLIERLDELADDLPTRERYMPLHARLSLITEKLCRIIKRHCEVQHDH